MPRDPATLVAKLTPVQRIVYDWAREGASQAAVTSNELQRVRIIAFNSEIGNQNYAAGCFARGGYLTNPDIIARLRRDSDKDATGIVNTFNYDLAAAIIRVGSEHPTLNRYQYGSYMAEWYSLRAEWKDPQIAQFADLDARAMAQTEFYRRNWELMGTAKLQPTRAVCPVCQGWIRRGEVEMAVAINNPGPYHPNCPHFWETNPKKVAPGECAKLWNGV